MRAPRSIVVYEYEMNVTLPPGAKAAKREDLPKWCDWRDSRLCNGQFISGINRAVPGFANHRKGIRWSGGNGFCFSVRYLSGSAGLATPTNASHCAKALRDIYSANAKVNLVIRLVKNHSVAVSNGVYKILPT